MATPATLPSSKQTIFTEMKALLTLGIPLILTQIIQFSMGTVDTIMTGHYGTLDLAAVGIGEKSTICFVVLGVGTIAVVQIFVAQGHGAKVPKEEVGAHVAHAIWIALIYSFFAWLIVRNLLDYVNFMEMDPEVLLLAQEYMKAFSWGLPAVFLFTAFRGLIVGTGISSVTLVISIIGLLTNIIGNYTFIFGHFGASEMGGVGAGWTSTVANWTMFICIVGYVWKKKEYAEYRIVGSLFEVSKKKIGELLRVGIPVGMIQFSEISLFVVFAWLMGRYGVKEISANQIAINYAVIMFMIPVGLSIASGTRIGLAIGKKDLKLARIIGTLSILLGGGLMGISAIVIVLFPQQISQIYTNDPELIALTSQFLIWVAVFQISDGVQVSAVGVLRGFKDTKFPMITNIFSYTLLGFGSGLFMGIYLDWGPRGLWYGTIVGLTSAAFILCLRFNSLSKNFSFED